MVRGQKVKIFLGISFLLSLGLICYFRFDLIRCKINPSYLSCSIKYNPWFSSRFHKEVPVFLSKSETLVFEQFLPDKNRSKLFAESVDELSSGALGRINSGRSGKISCAVIGNAPNLLQSNYGKFIDEHAFVFRMNNAQVEGHERDVGSRTSFHVLHHWLEEIKHYDKDTITILNIFAFYENISAALQSLEFLLELLNQTKSETKLELARIPKNIAEFRGQLLLTHPEFFKYIMNSWFLPKKTTEQEALVPSTGFISIIIALHLCDSVDLFGFGQPDSQGIWQHYYEKKIYPVQARHKADFQWEFLGELERQGEGAVRVWKGADR